MKMLPVGVGQSFPSSLQSSVNKLKNRPYYPLAVMALKGDKQPAVTVPQFAGGFERVIGGLLLALMSFGVLMFCEKEASKIGSAYALPDEEILKDRNWLEVFIRYGHSYKAYEGFYKKAAAGVDLDPLILIAKDLGESNFNPDATSSAGAKGLGQLKPKFFNSKLKELGKKPKDITDPETNIILSAGYLGRLYNEFGSIDAACAAYFIGDTAFRKAGGKIANLSLEQKNKVEAYLKRVKTHYVLYNYLENQPARLKSILLAYLDEYGQGTGKYRNELNTKAIKLLNDLGVEYY